MIRTLRVLAVVVVILGLVSAPDAMAQEKKKKKIPPGVAELEIGTKAFSFTLKGTDDEMYSYQDVAGKHGTLVIFTCNHCPYAKAYEDRIIALTKEWKKKGVGVVAISSNDPVAYPDDSFEKMKVRAKEKEFNFPYLFDETQAVALEYGPMVTPHIFLFDSTATLVYRGRIDDSAKPEEVKKHDLKNALLAVTSGDEVPLADTKAFGCSIKWRDAVMKFGKPVSVATKEKKGM